MAFVAPFLCCYVVRLQPLVVKEFELIFAVLYFFSREAIENQRGKVLKENSIIGRDWSSAKLFIVQKYTENANGDGS